MFTEKHFPTSLTGSELDIYLDRGWYRMGQTIFTCHFLFFDDNLYSPVWTRLPLKGYQFRKTLRKILNKNEQAFRTVIRPGVIDDEKEKLFQAYRSGFKGRLSPSLRSSLLDNAEVNIYATYEVAVYDGSRLIAFSFFDLGKNSIASIKGVYDPRYSSYSLGLFTMLMEIDYGMKQGYQYFYPGYIVPGYPRFDYKLRVGKPEEVEFFDLKAGGWFPYSTFKNEHVPVSIVSGKLSEIAGALSNAGIVCQMLFYPAYEANVFGYDNERYLESPLFLNCFNNIFPSPRFIVFYDLWKEKFVFCHCMPREDLTFYLEYSMQFDSQQAKHFLDFLMKKSIIVESANAGEVVRWAQLIKGLIKKPFRRDFLK